MKRIRMPFGLLLFCHSLCAQKTITAQVVDSITRQAVAFASISLTDRNAGTLSNEQGQFSLVVDDSLHSPIKISALGYETRFVNSRNCSQVLALPAVFTKEPFLVSAFAGRRSHLSGNRVRNNSFSTNIGGRCSEVALRIPIDHPKTQLASFFVKLVEGGSDSLPVFRINVYWPKRDGQPGTSLLRANIIVRAEAKSGLLEMDLRNYHILTDQDIFVSLEWLNDPGDKGFLIASSLFGKQTWRRQGGKQKWSKSYLAKPCIYAKLVY